MDVFISEHKRTPKYLVILPVLTVTNSIPGILASDEDDVDDSNFVSIMLTFIGLVIIGFMALIYLKTYHRSCGKLLQKSFTCQKWNCHTQKNCE